jgi:amidase
MDDFSDLDATAQAELVRTGQASPLELVQESIARIEKLNPELNAVIHERFERALAEASSDKLPDGPFKGVPFVVKDLDGQTAGDPIHAGMNFLKKLGYVAEFDSFSHAKLRAAGFVFVGKTNCSELGLVPTTEPAAYGPTHNPWDTSRSPGGSSGGTAAAVASRMAPCGSGGDVGGSIRIPASECGLVGLKPTRGRVSLGPEFGEVAAGFVARGAITRSVRDAAAVLGVMSGPMPGDPAPAAPPTRPYSEEVGVDPGRLRIGTLLEVPGGSVEVQPVVADVARRTAELLTSLGHDVDESSPSGLGDPELGEHFLNIFSSSVARGLDYITETAGTTITADDVEPVTWLFAEMGRKVTAVEYITAVDALAASTRRSVVWWHEGHDLLLTPTIPEVPPVLGSFGSAEDPYGGLAKASGIVPFAVPFNVSGQPAISLPVGWDEGGLPIGVQLVAAFGREDLLVRVAHQLEEARPWADRRPPIS